MTPARLALAALVLGLAACATRGDPRDADTAAPVTAASDAPVAAAGAAPDDNLNAVAWIQTSVEYRMLAEQTYRNATEKLDAAIADPTWDALPKEERRSLGEAKRYDTGDLPPAVILDIDETVLDNSPYQARLIRDGGEYDEFSWDQWVREEAAEPIPGALEFTRAAAANGVTVFYLSNRAEHLGEATLANLRKLGFPLKHDDRADAKASREVGERVFLGLGTFVAGCEQQGSEKGCRRRLAGQRYRVIMQFGDQLGDFVSILANTREGREQALAPYVDWIGERWWMLPNPSYGSWEPALFDNRYEQSREQRRQRKIDALRF